MKRRMKRSRVAVSGDTSPRTSELARCSARRWKAWSTTYASAKASSIVTTAEIHSSFSRQNSSIVPSIISVAERTRAVLLDALGTLVHFEPPAPLLRAGLRERLGVEVTAEAAEAAIRDEIAYYRAHLHEGR